MLMFWCSHLLLNFAYACAYALVKTSLKRPEGILLAISMRISFFDVRLLSDIGMGLSLATILVAGAPLKC